MEDQAKSKDRSYEGELTLLEVLVTLRRHRRSIVGMTVGAAALALAYSIGSLFLPPEKSYLPNFYTPEAHILISGGDSGGLSSALSSAGLGSLASVAGFSGGGSSSGELGLFLAQSASVLDELNGEFGFSNRYKVTKNVVAMTRKKMLEKLMVSFQSKTRIMTISYTDKDPAFAQRVVNRHVEILERRFAALGGNKARDQRDLLEQKLAEVKTAMDRIEGEVKVFQTKYGVISIEALETEQVTILARLRSELILKDIEVANYENLSRIDDPNIKRLRFERESTQAKIHEIEQGGGDKILPSLRDIPNIAFEYAALQRDLLVQTEIFKILTQQYELAKLNAEIQDPAFQVIEYAEIPDMKSGPSRGRICIVATMAAFAVAVVFAFLAEAVRKKGDPAYWAKIRKEV